MDSAGREAPAGWPIWIALQQWRWRGLFLFAGLLTSLVIELLEERLLGSQGFLIDVFFYGIVLPVVLLTLLTIWAGHMTRRYRREQIQEQHRRFTQQLSLCQDWDELTRFIVRYPASLLAIDHASLFIYDHRQAGLEFVAEWNIVGGLNSPVNRYLSGVRGCALCLRARPSHLHGTATCAAFHDLPDARSADEYCLPLVYEGLITGALRLRSQAGRPLERDEIHFLESVAPQIAVALGLSIAHPRQIDLARVEAQVTERRRIVQQLHDSLAQQVFFLQLGLDQLIGDETMHLTEPGRQKLERMRYVTGEIYEQIRNNLSTLRSWEEAGFSQAILGLAQSVARRTGLKIDVTSEGAAETLAASNFERAFGLVQESLNNVEKHARAQHVQIVLTWATHWLTISVADDGIGFDPSTVSAIGHYGLALMREKVAALQGEFQIDSVLGQGTRIHFRIPLQSAGAGSEAPGMRWTADELRQTSIARA